MSDEAVIYTVAEGVATLTLNRPERMNAWNADIDQGMSAALAAARDDDAVRSIIVTGAGRAFCAGADLGGGGDTFAGRGEPDSGRNAPQLLPYQVTKPVIAAINGPAVGIGMTYPMLCDVRLAADTAKLGFVFTRRGMMPELAAHTIVQRVAGFSNAAHLLMSGRIVTGTEAAELGIVTRAVPKDELMEAARAMAAESPGGAGVCRDHQETPLGRDAHGHRGHDGARGAGLLLGWRPGGRARGHPLLPREARSRVEALRGARLARRVRVAATENPRASRVTTLPTRRPRQ